MAFFDFHEVTINELGCTLKDEAHIISLPIIENLRSRGVKADLAVPWRI